MHEKNQSTNWVNMSFCKNQKLTSFILLESSSTGVICQVEHEHSVRIVKYWSNMSVGKSKKTLSFSFTGIICQLEFVKKKQWLQHQSRYLVPD